MIQLTREELATLVALIERGPLLECNIPSNDGLERLINLNFVAEIIYNGLDGYFAATYQGRDKYQTYFKGSSLLEAIENRRQIYPNI